MIYIKSVNEVYEWRNVAIWLLSTFKAGFINSAGFLATGKFVSHVTGFGTQAGIAIGHSDYFFGLELLIIPVSFILGGVITSIILERSSNKEEKKPPLFLAQGLITALIGVVILLGENISEHNVPFDIDNKYDTYEFTIISMLCLICGLKNGLVTWATFGKIRVTHLTGLSTDIGLNFKSMLKGKDNFSRMREKPIVNWIRILVLACFTIGAIVSAILIPLVGFSGFLVVFLISSLMTYISILDYFKSPCRP